MHRHKAAPLLLPARLGDLFLPSGNGVRAEGTKSAELGPRYTRTPTRRPRRRPGTRPHRPGLLGPGPAAWPRRPHPAKAAPSPSLPPLRSALPPRAPRPASPPPAPGRGAHARPGMHGLPPPRGARSPGRPQAALTPGSGAPGRRSPPWWDGRRRGVGRAARPLPRAGPGREPLSALRAQWGSAPRPPPHILRGAPRCSGRRRGPAIRAAPCPARPPSADPPRPGPAPPRRDVRAAAAATAPPPLPNGVAERHRDPTGPPG